jgi:hypothetical protein
VDVFCIDVYNFSVLGTVLYTPVSVVINGFSALFKKVCEALNFFLKRCTRNSSAWQWH